MAMQFDSELFYALKDALMVEFLKDDLNTVRYNLNSTLVHEDDKKLDEELEKAYNKILKYYGVTNG